MAISRVEEFSARLLALKKIFLPFSPQHGGVCFKDSKIPLFVLLPQNIVMPTKNLRFVLVL